MYREKAVATAVEVHPRIEETERISLCEALDRILNKGVLVGGGVTISVADVDLVYLGLNLMVASVETACAAAAEDPPEEAT